MSAGTQFSLVVIFFLYGLTFFTMGMALILESGRTQLLASQRVIRPLALFGLLHGLHEWIEIYLLQLHWLGGAVPEWFLIVRVALLASSFFPLVLFGTLSLQRRSEGIPFTYFVHFGLLITYVAVILIAGQVNRVNTLVYADIWARYLFAIPGALLTALALHQRGRQVLSEGRRNLSRSFELAAVGFGLYALSQVFVPEAGFFPASWLNAPGFLAVTHIPIQMFRAGMGVVIAYELVKAIQLVERERQLMLQAAQEARLEALERVSQELGKRENLRRELIQRTVIAQENERARIARELHDESAQLLTAISLSLATLRGEVRQNKGAQALVDRLQELSREMSRQMHRMVHDLRPAQLDDLGLVPALQFLVDEGRQSSGVDVSLVIQGQRSQADKLIETVVFRAAQEALNNIYRHAGVKTGEIIMNYAPSRIKMTVRDQGVGFDPNQVGDAVKGYGLAGMRERVESVRGSMKVTSVPGAGTTVEIIIPLTEKDTLDLLEENAYG